MIAVAPTVADDVLDSVGECLTPEVAQRLINLRADPKLQSRIDELGDKSNAGTLTDSERGEYEQYIRLWQFVSLLQAKARDILDLSPGAA